MKLVKHPYVVQLLEVSIVSDLSLQKESVKDLVRNHSMCMVNALSILFMQLMPTWPL